MDSLKKSFNGYKHNGKKLQGKEENTILLEHEDSGADSSGRREIVVDVDGESRTIAVSGEPSKNSTIWRESSYDFVHDGLVEARKAQTGPDDSVSGSGEFDFRQKQSPDPPSKLIGQFLHKQQASGEISLDMDLEMEELHHGHRLSLVRESSTPKQQEIISTTNSTPKQPETISRELRVSFQDSSTHNEDDAGEQVRRRRKSSSDDEDGSVDNEENIESRNSGEVLKCSSNSSFQRKTALCGTKSKSRLLDSPPTEDQGKSGMVGKKLKSEQLKSGMVGKIPEEEEDDPFLDEDLPEALKQQHISMLTIFQWICLFVILGAFVCSLTIPYLTRKTVWDLHLWKWVLMVLVLICGRLVSGWVIRLIVFFVERNFLLRKRVLYFVYSLRRAVQNCLWLGLVLIAWHYIFDKKVERATNSKTLPYVTKVLVCLLVGTLIWLVKTLLVKVLGSSFHVATYFDRIQDALFNQYVIETLSGPALIEVQSIKEDEQKVLAEVQNLENAGAKLPADLSCSPLPTKSGRVIGSGRLQRSPRISKSPRLSDAASKQQDDVITVDHLHKLNQKNVSAWNMKRLMNIVRHGVLTTLDEQISDVNQEDESAVQIRSEHEAKIAARKIFYNVAKPGSKHIYLIDLMRFMREDEALKTIALFEGANESKRIGKRALKDWMVSVFRERKALSLTLNDTKTAVNNLHQMVNVVVSIIIVVIWLLILGITTTHILVFISSQLLLVVFVFGNTCKMVFESIIFLFVMHPFDVGDRCELEGVQMVVEEMNILTTVFLRYDNMKIVYPNSVLSTKPLSNYYRSPDMVEMIDFCIHVNTLLDKVATMKERIKEYVEKKSDHWYPSPPIVLRDVTDMNKLMISIWVQHRMNFQDIVERWLRRERLMEEMIKVLRELNIEYRLLPRDVNVRNFPADSTRLPSTWKLGG